MPLHIIRQDITLMEVDAIVAAGSAAPGTPRPTGGVNGSIHKRAGARLLEAIRRLGGIRSGDVTLTEAYDLPCRYVIHTAGPKWQGGSAGEEAMLRACYRRALQLAARKGFASIAFPLISTGKYGYPKEEAMRVASGEIRDFLAENDMQVYLVVYDRESFQLSGGLFRGVKEFVDQHYVDMHYAVRRPTEANWAASDESAAPQPSASVMKRASAPADATTCAAQKAASADSDLPPELVRRLQRLDEGFTGMLLRLIDESGMKDADCYRRANVDRKLFSKIRSNPAYTPKKPTAAAFCIALRLPLPQTRELLAKAGYGMSRASVFDVILEYFITRGEYDVHTINQALWHYDQPLLGSIDKGA